MYLSRLRLSVIIVALCATRVLAAPDARRIAVLDFDGRQPLAERGHTLVVALLAEHHDLVPSQRWEDARAAAAAKWHGPAQWARAADKAGVDAVIEGWVADDHGRLTLYVLVRDAHDSSERTTTAVRFDASGTIPIPGHKSLLGAIETALATIDPAAEAPIEETPPVARLDIAPAAKRPAHPIDGRRVERRASEPPAPDRFSLEAGGYVGSRSLTMTAPGSVMPFSGVATHGMQARAEVSPLPAVGISGSVYRSLASSFTFVDLTEGAQHQLAIDQHGWELAVAYRHPVDAITVEGAVFYGAQAFAIADRTPSLAVPDTRYAYVGGGARIDVRAIEALSLGLGARYLAVLDTGELASADWYGPASAHGLGFDGTFHVTLPSQLFVHGQLAYRRISIGLRGGGRITDAEGVTSGTDSQLTFHLNLGVTF